MRLMPVPALLALILAQGLPAADPAAPWSGSFTMTLRGAERHFVQVEGASYLVLEDEDFATPDFLAGKDVALLAKFERGEGERIYLSSHPHLTLRSGRATWATRVEGDNCWVLGRFSDGSSVDVARLLPAPSDAQVVAERLARADAEDWPGRLAVAAWVRAQAQTKPNREYWLAQADSIVGDTMSAAAVAAERSKDFALLGQAMDWGTSEMNDPRRVARIASATWIRAAGGPGAEAVAKRMRRINYVAFQGEYRPQSEALALEYEARMGALSWKDAEGFYKLGRWCDDQAEVLPMAKDRAWKAYQAGFRADPHHAGIRNELGLGPDLAAGETLHGQVSDLHDPVTGAFIPAPVGWKQGEAIGGDVAWVDPDSDTAWISARTIPASPGESQDFALTWLSQVSQLQTRPGFQALGEDVLTVPEASGRLLRFSVPEGRFVRHGLLALIQPVHRHYAVRLESGGAEDERAAVEGAVRGMLPTMHLPAPAGAATAAALSATPAAPAPVAPPRPEAPHD